jgi:4a-hydroxytetrahydrobiopterin dehydratase
MGEAVMALSSRHCTPCEGDSAPLSDGAEDEFLKLIPGWEIDRSSEHRIKKTFKLKTFLRAIEFVNKIAVIAEKEGHHPDLHINYGVVMVELYTHAISGLSDNDFIIASKINEIQDATATIT